MRKMIFILVVLNAWLFASDELNIDSLFKKLKKHYKSIFT